MKTPTVKMRKNITIYVIVLVEIFIIYTAYSTGKILQSRENVAIAWRSLHDSHRETIAIFKKISTDAKVQLPEEFRQKNIQEIELNWFSDKNLYSFYHVKAHESYNHILEIESEMRAILKLTQGNEPDSVKIHSIVKTRLYANTQDYMNYIDSASSYKHVLEQELIYIPYALKKLVFREPQLFGFISGRH